MGREAERGGGYASIHRVMSVALEAGADAENPKLIRSIKLLENRLADKVLSDAKEAKARDSEAAARLEESTGSPPVGQAERALRSIKDAIKQAVSEHVPKDHRSLEEARRIIKELEQIESQRGFVAAKIKRQQARRAEQDAKQKK